jgi:hypothetical protein
MSARADITAVRAAHVLVSDEAVADSGTPTPPACAMLHAVLLRHMMSHRCGTARNCYVWQCGNVALHLR